MHLSSFAFDHQVNVVSFSTRRPRIACASFIEEYRNNVTILNIQESSDGLPRQLSSHTVVNHPYPATQVMWVPDRASSESVDLMATTGDYLRVWKIRDDGTNHMAALLNTNKTNDLCSPLTSFDWCTEDPRLIVTSSIDTTCTVWDLQTQQTRAHLIAHDRDVLDCAWAPSRDIFASCSSDHSLRMFDLRSLEHSTILYECQEPILRVDWNNKDHNLLSIFTLDDPKIYILDFRLV